MRVFVAGATGLTGRSVVRHAVQAGLTTIAHVRPDSSRLDDWRARFGALGAAVDTAPWTAEGMTDAMRTHRPDRVFALLGTTRKRAAAGGGDYEAVDYGLTVMLIDAMRAAELSSSRLVYLSSEGVGPTARGAYLKVRWRVEQHLEASGLAWTIARPSFIIGPRDQSRPGESIGAAFADGVLGVARALGARRTADRYRSITGDQLAAGLVRAAVADDAAGRILSSADLR